MEVLVEKKVAVKFNGKVGDIGYLINISLSTSIALSNIPNLHYLLLNNLE